MDDVGPCRTGSWLLHVGTFVLFSTSAAVTITVRVFGGTFAKP